MMLTDQIAEAPPLPPPAEPGQSNIAAVCSGLTDLETQARALIGQRPVVAVLAAFGAGYLVARLTSRVTR